MSRNFASFTTPVDISIATTGQGIVDPFNQNNTITLESAAPWLPSLQANNLEPSEYTLEFSVLGGVSLSNPPQGPGNYYPTPRAEITWKVGGQQARRVISVVSGAVISGVAEAVHVKIQDQAGVFGGTTNFPLSPQSSYKVIAMLSKGSRPSIQQPPGLISFPSIPLFETGVNPRPTAILAVPQDAGVISMFIYAGGSAGITVELLDLFNQNLGVVEIPLTDSGSGWIPLTPGTAKVLLNLNSTNPPNDTSRVQVIWGIEG